MFFSWSNGSNVKSYDFDCWRIDDNGVFLLAYKRFIDFEPKSGYRLCGVLIWVKKEVYRVGVNKKRTFLSEI